MKVYVCVDRGVEYILYLFLYIYNLNDFDVIYIYMFIIHINCPLFSFFLHPDDVC